VGIALVVQILGMDNDLFKMQYKDDRDSAVQKKLASFCEHFYRKNEDRI
jgi:hypothetical protein